MQEKSLYKSVINFKHFDMNTSKIIINYFNLIYLGNISSISWFLSFLCQVFMNRSHSSLCVLWWISFFNIFFCSITIKSSIMKRGFVRFHLWVNVWTFFNQQFHSFCMSYLDKQLKLKCFCWNLSVLIYAFDLYIIQLEITIICSAYFNMWIGRFIVSCAKITGNF